jgi:hypothetical protein
MRKTPVVLGVLSIVFGSLMAAWKAFSLLVQGLVSNFLGGMGQMMKDLPRQPGAPDPTAVFDGMKNMMQNLMHQLAPYTYAVEGGKILMSIALVVIGYGLYKRLDWGRTGAIGWSVLALLFIVFELVVQLTVVMPRMNAAMQDFYARLPGGLGAQQAAMMNAMSSGPQAVSTVVMTILFLAPYPIVLLALCGRPSARNDFVS